MSTSTFAGVVSAKACFYKAELDASKYSKSLGCDIQNLITTDCVTGKQSSVICEVSGKSCNTKSVDTFTVLLNSDCTKTTTISLVEKPENKSVRYSCIALIGSSMLPLIYEVGSEKNLNRNLDSAEFVEFISNNIIEALDIWKDGEILFAGARIRGSTVEVQSQTKVGDEIRFLVESKSGKIKPVGKNDNEFSIRCNPEN